MKILIPTLLACIFAYVASVAISNAVVSHNQAYAVVEVAKQHTKQTEIEWDARVDVAQIEADRDLGIAQFEMWSSPAWNAGSIIRGMLWALAFVIIVFLIVGTGKLTGII